MLRPFIAELDGMSAESVVRALAERGMLNRRIVEAYYVRKEMERLTHHGMTRTAAMRQIADGLCCSYEKVRGFVYDKYIL